MEVTEPFCLFDCSLVRRATGRVCVNLRDLLDAIHTVPDAVLEHHMMRCALEDHFELHEFPNDLARWCWDALGDHVLGEQLGLVDPYLQPSMCGTAIGADKHASKIGCGDRSSAVVPLGHGTSTDRIAFDRLRHRRAHLHSGRAAGSNRTHVFAVLVLSRPRSAAPYRRGYRRFFAVAGKMRR